MEFISRWVDQVLNRCPSCGFSAIALCDRCWLVLNPVRSPSTLITITTKPFLQRVLYQWDDRIESTSSILRELILSSKRRPRRHLMRIWADEFRRRTAIEGAIVKRWLIVPAPGRSGQGELDHAGLLAFEIATVLGSQVEFAGDVLERLTKTTGTQKTKSKKERREIEYRVTDAWKDRIRLATGVIFVDDVIVTGSTANAAWAALGRPDNFECWAIAFKVKALDAGENG